MIYLKIYIALSLVAMLISVYMLHKEDQEEVGDLKFGKNFKNMYGKFTVSVNAWIVLLATAPGTNLISVAVIIINLPKIIKATPNWCRGTIANIKENRHQAILLAEFKAEQSMPWSFIRGSVVLKEKYAEEIKRVIDEYKHSANAPLWAMVDFDFRPGSTAHAVYLWLVSRSYLPGEAQSKLWGFGQDRTEDTHNSRKPESILKFGEDGKLYFYDSRLEGTQDHLAFVDLLEHIAIDFSVQLDVTRISQLGDLAKQYHFTPERNVYHPSNEEILTVGFAHRNKKH